MNLILSAGVLMNQNPSKYVSPSPTPPSPTPPSPTPPSPTPPSAEPHRLGE